MIPAANRPCTAFEGFRTLHSGPLDDVALAVKAAYVREPAEPILVFDDTTGRVVDLDLRGTDQDVVGRLSGPPPAPGAPESSRARGPAGSDDTAPANGARGRGRPRLGVVAREVTLLPRQWEWLSSQPGGASAELRRLVDAARKTDDPRRKRRAAQDAAYRFMQAIAGDLPGYEEATRALFADDGAHLARHIDAWPPDVRAHVLRLAALPD